jgi:drug/metabolite transporter (DMT)-like permease
VAHLAFLFCCVVWGTSFILLERVTHVMGPVEIGIWRLLCGAVVVGFCWWLKRDAYRVTGRDLALIAISSLLFTAPPQIIQAYVLEQGFGHGFFGTMVAAIPLITILVSVPMLGVRPTMRELVGVLGGLACIFLLVEDGMQRGMSLGLLALTMLIPLSSALSNTFYKWMLPHVPAAPLTTLILIVSAFALMPLQATPGMLATMHVAAPIGVTVSPDAVVFLLLLGIVGSGISTMTYIWLVLKRGPLFAGMTTYVVPVIALLWGTLDNETISGQQIAAIAGVLMMVVIVQTGSKRTSDELIFEPAAAGEFATSLPLSAEVGHLVTLPMTEMSQKDRRAAASHAQVA